ncbi:MAG TPA: glycosyltransferase family 1 protein [Puia sp.]|nr:glycosyltransferase family 1 protein [Puia sp.]
MIITQVFRKKDPAFFSIERVFSGLDEELEKRTQIRRVSVPRFGISFHNLLAIAPFFHKALRADGYHVTGHIHYAVLGFPSRRVLLTIHDCVFLYQVKGWRRWILKKLLLDWPVRHAALITTISEASRQDILRHTGCRPDKVVVIPNPVNEAISFTPLTFHTDRPVILFVGATPNKNLLRVIPALEGIPAELHIVGEIPAAAMQLLEQHHVSYRQSTRLDDKQLAACYRDADLVLFPSTFEGFGLPILEAQQAGRPVVTSDLEPMKGVAGSGACLVDPLSVGSIRAGILKVIREPAYRATLIENGRGNVRRFDKAVIAEQYFTCYKKLTQ